MIKELKNAASLEQRASKIALEILKKRITTKADEHLDED